MYAAGYIPEGTIFPALEGGTNAIKTCDARYNISTPSGNQLRKQYHFTPADLRNSTRIIWSLGQYDPTSGVSPNAPGINAPSLSVDRNVSRILYTTNMAHGEDLFSPLPDDRETVVQVRRMRLQAVVTIFSLVLVFGVEQTLMRYICRRDKSNLSQSRAGWGCMGCNTFIHMPLCIPTERQG